MATPNNDMGLQWEHLHDKLADVSQLQAEGHDVAAKSSDGALSKKRHDEFVKQRKKHYNEFELAKKYAEEHADEDVDDES